MSSANAVVNALNWVGKATLSLEVVALVAVVAMGLAAAWNHRHRRPTRTSALMVAAVAAVMLLLTLSTITSTQRLAKAYRTVRGGVFMGSLV